MAKAKQQVMRKELERLIRRNYENKIAFANSLGVSPATVSKWLYTDTVPSRSILQLISRNTGLTLAAVYDLFPVPDTPQDN